MYTLIMNNATVIQEQIGGKAFFMMGASALVDTGEGLQFKIKGSPRKVSSVVVSLDHTTDSYTVEFWNTRGKNFDLISKETGVMVSDLHRTIERHTALRLSL